MRFTTTIRLGYTPLAENRMQSSNQKTNPPPGGEGRSRSRRRFLPRIVMALLALVTSGAPLARAQPGLDVPPAAGTVGLPADDPGVVEAAPPAPAPAEGLPGSPSEDAIVLNFEGADIREVVHSLASALEINYLIDPRVSGQVTIRTTGKIPRSELFPIFNQILRSIGIAAIQVGEVYNIVPIADAKTRVIVSRAELERMSADDLFVVELVRVHNISSDEMANLLQPFVTPGGDVLPYSRANMLVITDLASNVDRLREMIQLLDRDSFRDLQAKIYKIEHANLEELGEELLAILDTYGITGQAATERGVYAIPLVRLNSIAVLAFNDNVFETISYWLGLLDVPPDDDSRRSVRVYNVQNAKAADLATVLNELYGGGQGGGRGGGRGAGQPGFGGVFGRASGGAQRRGAASASSGRLGSPSQARAQGGGGGGGGGRRSGGGGARPAGVLGGQAGGAGGRASSFVLAGGEGGLSFFKEEVRIVADEISNSLVILATRRDYDEIRKVLLDLDVVPRQVVIEVLIAEINLNKGMDMGLQSVITNTGGVGPVPQPSSNGSTDSSGSALGRIAQSSGINDDALKRLWNVDPSGALTAIITDQSTFRFTLTALAEAGRLKVLASPHLLTADNREASINIGKSIPIITSTQQSTVAVSNLVQQVQYRDTGVILNILPQVNADGLVNLQVRQEVSEVDDNFSSSTGSPAFILREAETTAVVQDGDSLLIGGIIQETTSRSRSGVPYLMDIPVMGQLFRFESSDVRRVELIILLTPHVVRNRAEALEVTQRYKDRLWDVIDEIDRTAGLEAPTPEQMRAIERNRSRTTTAERPQMLLPNRAWED